MTKMFVNCIYSIKFRTKESNMNINANLFIVHQTMSHKNVFFIYNGIFLLLDGIKNSANDEHKVEKSQVCLTIREAN